MNANDATPMIKIGNALFPLDRLPHDLRRRWDNAQARKALGEDQRTNIATLMKEIEGALGLDMLFRAAHKAPQSALGIGMTEKDATAHGATFRSLSAEADAEADKEKRKEGIKESAGKKTRCPLCGGKL